MTPFQSLTIPFSPLSLGICRLADCIFTPKSVFSLWDAGHAFVVSHSLESLNCPRLFSWIPQSNEENPKVKARGPTAKAWTHCPPVTCGTDGRLFSTPAETDAQWTQSDTERRKEAARLKAEAESDLLAEYSAYRRNAGLHATFLCRTSTDEEKWKLMQIMKRGKNQMKRDLSLVPL